MVVVDFLLLQHSQGVKPQMSPCKTVGVENISTKPSYVPVDIFCLFLFSMSFLISRKITLVVSTSRL